MKILLAVVIFLFSMLGAYAQSLEIPTEREAYIQHFTQLLKLNQTQQAKMGRVFDTKQQALKEVYAIEKDEAVIREKTAHIAVNTEGSVRLMLSGEQIKRFNQYKRDRRQYRYERTKLLEEQKASSDQINNSLSEGDF